MKTLWNAIKTLHFKWRHEAILTEMFFEQMGYESEVSFNDWMRIHNVITWPQRKQQLIDKGTITQ